MIISPIPQDILVKMGDKYEKDARAIIAYYQEEKQRIFSEIKEEAQSKKIKDLTLEVLNKLKNIERNQKNMLSEELKEKIRFANEREKVKAWHEEEKDDISVEDLYFIDFILKNGSKEDIVKAAEKYKNSPKAKAMINTYKTDDEYMKNSLEAIINPTSEVSMLEYVLRNIEINNYNGIIFTSNGKEIVINDEVPPYNFYF